MISLSQQCLVDSEIKVQVVLEIKVVSVLLMRK